MTIQPTAPGALQLASLTGAELVSVISGGPVQQVCTTDQIAGLASLGSSGAVLTTINTVGAGSLTAAALVGGNINRTGVQVAAFTDTTVSAATIIAALPAGAPVGTSFKVTYANNQTGAAGYVATIAGGSNVSVSGITKVPTGSSATYLVTYSAANTVTMVGTSSGLANTTQLDLAGSTSGQTTLIPTAISAASVLTLPAATDQLVGRATTDTLTNKTLTAPVIATIVNTGTLTLGSVTGTVAQTSGANLYVADVYRSTSLSIQNSVTPTLITGLAGAVAIGTYNFRAVIDCTPAATGGIALSFVLTTAVLGACNFITQSIVSAAAPVLTKTTTTTSATSLLAVATIPTVAYIDGTFTVSTAGTFSLYGCQNTQVNSAATINTGCTMELTRIA